MLPEHPASLFPPLELLPCPNRPPPTCPTTTSPLAYVRPCLTLKQHMCPQGHCPEGPKCSEGFLTLQPPQTLCGVLFAPIEVSYPGASTI